MQRNDPGRERATAHSLPMRPSLRLELARLLGCEADQAADEHEASRLRAMADLCNAHVAEQAHRAVLLVLDGGELLHLKSEGFAATVGPYHRAVGPALFACFVYSPLAPQGEEVAMSSDAGDAARAFVEATGPLDALATVGAHVERDFTRGGECFLCARRDCPGFVLDDEGTVRRCFDNEPDAGFAESFFASQSPLAPCRCGEASCHGFAVFNDTELQRSDECGHFRDDAEALDAARATIRRWSQAHVT